MNWFLANISSLEHARGIPEFIHEGIFVISMIVFLIFRSNVLHSSETGND